MAIPHASATRTLSAGFSYSTTERAFLVTLLAGTGEGGSGLPETVLATPIGGKLDLVVWRSGVSNVKFFCSR